MELTKETIFKKEFKENEIYIPLGEYKHKSYNTRIEVIRSCGKYIEVIINGLLSAKLCDFLKDFDFIPKDNSQLH